MASASGPSLDRACVAELAASLEGLVTVVTSDLTGIPPLLAVAGSDALVRRV